MVPVDDDVSKELRARRRVVTVRDGYVMHADQLRKAGRVQQPAQVISGPTKLGVRK